MIRIAMISQRHVRAKDYARQVKEHPKALPSPICQWLDAIRGNGKTVFTLREGHQLPVLMVTVYS